MHERIERNRNWDSQRESRESGADSAGSFVRLNRRYCRRAMNIKCCTHRYCTHRTYNNERGIQMSSCEQESTKEISFYCLIGTCTERKKVTEQNRNIFLSFFIPSLAHAQKEEKLLSRTKIYILCLSVLLTFSTWLDRLFLFHYCKFYDCITLVLCVCSHRKVAILSFLCVSKCLLTERLVLICGST